MKTSMLLTALLAALILTGCSTYRGGTVDTDTGYTTGRSADEVERAAPQPMREFTQPIPPP
jgi:hypothetical protein